MAEADQQCSSNPLDYQSTDLPRSTAVLSSEEEESVGSAFGPPNWLDTIADQTTPRASPRPVAATLPERQLTSSTTGGAIALATASSSEIENRFQAEQDQLDVSQSTSSRIVNEVLDFEGG